MGLVYYHEIENTGQIALSSTSALNVISSIYSAMILEKTALLTVSLAEMASSHRKSRQVMRTIEHKVAVCTIYTKPWGRNIICFKYFNRLYFLF